MVAVKVSGVEPNSDVTLFADATVVVVGELSMGVSLKDRIPRDRSFASPGPAWWTHHCYTTTILQLTRPQEHQVVTPVSGSCARCCTVGRHASQILAWCMNATQSPWYSNVVRALCDPSNKLHLVDVSILRVALTPCSLRGGKKHAAGVCSQ